MVTLTGSAGFLLDCFFIFLPFTKCTPSEGGNLVAYGCHTGRYPTTCRLSVVRIGFAGDYSALQCRAFITVKAVQDCAQCMQLCKGFISVVSAGSKFRGTRRRLRGPCIAPFRREPSNETRVNMLLPGVVTFR